MVCYIERDGNGILIGTKSLDGSSPKVHLSRNSDWKLFYGASLFSPFLSDIIISVSNLKKKRKRSLFCENCKQLERTRDKTVQKLCGGWHRHSQEQEHLNTKY